VPSRDGIKLIVTLARYRGRRIMTARALFLLASNWSQPLKGEMQARIRNISANGDHSPPHAGQTSVRKQSENGT